MQGTIPVGAQQTGSIQKWADEQHDNNTDLYAKANQRAYVLSFAELMYDVLLFMSFLWCVRVLLHAFMVPSTLSLTPFLPSHPPSRHIHRKREEVDLNFLFQNCLPSFPPSLLLPYFFFICLEGLEHLLGRRNGGVDVGLGVGQGHEARLVLGGGQVEPTLEHATVPLGKLSLREGERKGGREGGGRDEMRN